MAQVTYRVCDRCKKPLSEHDYRRMRLNVKKRRLRVRSRIGQYVDDYEYELCNECTIKLDGFLYPKQEEGLT